MTAPTRTLRTVAALLAAAAATLVLTGCALPKAAGGHQEQPRAAGQSLAASGAAAPSGTSTDPAATLAKLGTLRIAPEDTGAHYNRKDWKHWIGQPGFGRGCDTREMVLIQQGHRNGGGAVERDPSTCAPLAGHGNTWTSSYDDVTVADPATLDVDHVVPLEEVARSGARGWTAAQRQAYANDPTVLLVVTARSNRQKGSSDPSKWLPVHKCAYVTAWTGLKSRYRLAVDQAEHDAIVSILRRCG